MITRCTRCKREPGKGKKLIPLAHEFMKNYLCDDCFQGVIVYLHAPIREARELVFIPENLF